jgi:hypothetical protein
MQHEVAEQTNEILSALHTALLIANKDDPEHPVLSQLSFSTEDNNVLIEWVFSDFRAGYYLCPKHEESTYFYITIKIGCGPLDLETGNIVDNVERIAEKTVKLALKADNSWKIPHYSISV